MRYFCDVIYNKGPRVFYEVPEGEDPYTFIEFSDKINSVSVIEVKENIMVKCDGTEHCMSRGKCVHSIAHSVCTQCFAKSVGYDPPCNRYHCRPIKKKSFEF